MIRWAEYLVSRSMLHIENFDEQEGLVVMLGMVLVGWAVSRYCS